MELSFIVACLTHQLDPDWPLPEPPAELDWNRVYHLLVRHKLAELFCVLGEAHPGLWSPELQRSLRKQRYTALLYGDHCVPQVRTVLSALRQADLPVIVLKGWALIPTAYGGDYGQRTYADIDLLVSPHDMARVEDILGHLGYRGAIPEPWPAYRRRYGLSQSYVLSQEPPRFGSTFAVGLHSGLLGTAYWDRRVTVEGFFARSQSLQVAGVEVRGLAAEDDTVYACGHLGLHHSYDEALSRYYEMASVIVRAGPSFDWNVVTAQASVWRLTLPVRRIIAHLESLWPNLVPASALDAIARLKPTRSERYVHSLEVKHYTNYAVHALVNCFGLPGLSNRVRFILETAFPNPSYMRQCCGPSPGGFLPLLYLRRVVAPLIYLTRLVD